MTLTFRWSRLIAAFAVLGTLSTATVALAADPLVSTAWLQDNLNNPTVRVIEVSVEPGQFERGHIPGAVNVVWHSDLVDTVRRDIALKESFEKLASRAGIGADTTVVLYGDNNNWFAA
jgi:thiosulfate/3-mercaptopyruvate sulfurtransferase